MGSESLWNLREGLAKSMTENSELEAKISKLLEENNILKSEIIQLEVSHCQLPLNSEIPYFLHEILSFSER